MRQKLAGNTSSSTILTKLVAIFVYLSVFFLGFRLYTRLILTEYQINFFEYGLSLTCSSNAGRRRNVALALTAHGLCKLESVDKGASSWCYFSPLKEASR
jgi:hypothetical protein